ncbi:FAD-dependent oxidoreductase [Nocardioides sp. cx-169]|uniref:FAD-dependent oxidoreductase n=1 Tax=Nocardioides sp. cx-169 TaxID=2899080 RepID=UPI001E3BA5D8|nr:FAD-dependent oxidoreductase [Nocardioides sp. cx-169]MCD4533710.1 FAD-dependent oxidoreductase [Nocardioides sp. cx-169]
MPAPHRLVIVGAGPIGLAAAAHAHSRGLRTLILEAGTSAGAAVGEWGHVRLFSAWSELVDPAGAARERRVRRRAGRVVPNNICCRESSLRPKSLGTTRTGGITPGGARAAGRAGTR